MKELTGLGLAARFARADGAGRPRDGKVTDIVGDRMVLESDRRPPRGSTLNLEITLGPGLGRLSLEGVVQPGKRALSGSGPARFEVVFDRGPAIDAKLAALADGPAPAFELDHTGCLQWPLGQGNWRVGEDSDGRSLCAWLGERWVGAKPQFGAVTTDVGHLASRDAHVARVNELAERIHESSAEVVPLTYHKLILAPGAGVPRAEMPNAPEVGGFQRTDERWLEVIAAQMRVVDALDAASWKPDQLEGRHRKGLEEARADVVHARKLVEEKAASDGAGLTWIRQAREELGQLDDFLVGLLESVGAAVEPVAVAEPAREAVSEPDPAAATPRARVSATKHETTRVASSRGARRAAASSASTAVDEEDPLAHLFAAGGGPPPRGMPAGEVARRIPADRRRTRPPEARPAAAESPAAPAGDRLQRMAEELSKPSSRRAPESDRGTGTSDRVERPRTAAGARRDGRGHVEPQVERSVRRRRFEPPSRVLVVGLLVAVMAYAAFAIPRQLGAAGGTSSAAVPGVDLGALAGHLPIEGFSTDGGAAVITVSESWGELERSRRWASLVEACAVLAEGGQRSALVRDRTGRELATWRGGTIQVL